MRIKTTDIINEIQNKFHKKYKAFGKLRQEPIYKDLMNTIKDPKKMNYIIQRNNLYKEPPTKVFLRLNPHIYQNYKLRVNQINESIGAFWGFIFKFILNCSGKKNIPINIAEVKSASYFYYKDIEDEKVVIVQ